MKFGNRVIPQRCECGPLPTDSGATGHHQCPCGRRYIAKDWNGLLAWFAVPSELERLHVGLAKARHAMREVAAEMRREVELCEPDRTLVSLGRVTRWAMRLEEETS